MKRSDFIRTLLAASAAPFLPQNLFARMQDEPLSKAQFGKDFLWGLSASAYQTEGAWNIDGKSPSIWDVFAHKEGKIKTGENGDVACDFYHRYPEDIAMMKQLNFQVNRFSLSWSRLKPDGIGRLNPLGVDFYNRVIDRSLEVGVQPWITMFHWDLPWTLYERGGWQNRDVIDWFSEYTYDASRLFGDRVKNWMILNEPMAFTALGHMLGMHAPGKKNPLAFLAASHHAAMVQAEAGRIVRQNVKGANIGTNFSCQHVEAIDDKEKNQKAALKADALLNRMFVEPSLGLGYPVKDAPIIRWIEKYMKEGDEQKLKFDFDFIGIQNYTRVVMKAALNPLGMKEVTPQERGVPYTEMNWEVYPEGIYHLLKKFAAYPQVKKIIVTENGAAFPDTVQLDGVHDAERVAFFQAYLKQVLRAKQEGVNVGGYFVWTMMDNFEWAEGYKPRFGLVHVDFETQKRTIKDSGLWFQEFLKD